MEKFSRWTDDKNRLHVVIARWSEVEHIGEEIHLIPASVELLDVHNEKVNIISAANFEKYITDGLLKQVLKNS